MAGLGGAGRSMVPRSTPIMVSASNLDTSVASRASTETVDWCRKPSILGLDEAD